MNLPARQNRFHRSFAVSSPSSPPSILVIGLFAALLSCVAAMPASAQVFGPRPPIAITPIVPLPPAPQVTTPPIGVQEANASVQKTVALTWYQPELVATQPPMSATHFIVCLQAPGLSCAWPGMTTGVWTFAATGAGITRTPRLSGSPYTTAPRIVQGYQYSATVTINTTQFDTDLQWTFGSCASNTTNSCKFVSPGNLRYSTRDLFAQDASMTHNPTQMNTRYSMFATFPFRNDGTSDLVNFIVGYHAVQVLERGGACERDPSAADPSFQSVLLDDGRFVFPNAIPTGAAVNAIVKPNGNASAFFQFGPYTLAPGAAAFASGIPTDPFAATHTFGWGGDTVRAYAIVAVADHGNRIKEFNESNNGNVACYVMFK